MSGNWNQRRDHRPAQGPRPAPEPTGDLIASFERPGYRGSPASEVRVTLDEFNGHPFLSIRLWEIGQGGEYFPTKKGLSVRLNEVQGVAAALLRGLGLANGGRDRHAVAPPRQDPPRGEPPRSTAPRAAQPQRALPAPPPEAATEIHTGFDEFSEV